MAYKLLLQFSEEQWDVINNDLKKKREMFGVFLKNRIVKIEGENPSEISSAADSICKILDKALNKKRGMKNSVPQTISLKVLLTNDQCGDLLGLKGENKREIEKNTGVSLIISHFYVDQYRTVMVSGKCESISLFVQRVVQLQDLEDPMALFLVEMGEPNVDQIASKKCGDKKKSADSVDAIAEEKEENKKKPTKKKATSESPEPKPEPQKVGKVAAAKRGTKRGQTEDPSVPVEEKKQGSKKGDNSPELPLRVVNGLEEETKANPLKRSPVLTRQRVKRAVVQDADSEETEENKKKPTKKKATSESPEPKPEPQKVGKVAAAKRGTKRGQTVDPSVPVEEKKQGSKKGDKSPELPLRVVNGLEEESEANPPKRNKASDKAETAEEEPEKKAVRGRKKKEDPQPVETENKSRDDGKKKAKRVGKEEATVEVEKKKPVGRKKAAAAQEKEPDTVTSPVLTKQRGKRAVVQDADSDVFVAVISGQQSTDPSPAGPPVTKGRRLKLVLEKLPAASAQADSDEEISVPAVATKRNYTRRNK